MTKGRQRLTVSEFHTAYPTACLAAQEWLVALGPDVTMQRAWRECPNSEWMLWALHAIAHKSFPGPRHFAMDCAEWDHQRRIAAGETVKPEDVAVLAAVRAYLSGEGTAEQMSVARAVTWNAAAATAETSAWAAARNAAYATANATANAAWDVEYAARNAGATTATGSAAADSVEAAWKAARSWQADRLRLYVPEWPGER